MLSTWMKVQSVHIPLKRVTLPPFRKTPEKRESRLFLEQTPLLAVKHSPRIQQVNWVTGTPHIPLVSYQNLTLAPKPGLRTLTSIYPPPTRHLQKYLLKGNIYPSLGSNTIKKKKASFNKKKEKLASCATGFLDSLWPMGVQYLPGGWQVHGMGGSYYCRTGKVPAFHTSVGAKFEIHFNTKQVSFILALSWSIVLRTRGVFM